jgi:outer membrane protein OmpA-like peptidoglycan-associated protein
MSTPIKILLLLLAWLLYSALVFKSCKKELCLSCGDSATTGILAPPDGQADSTGRYPIDFQWGNAQPLINEGGDAQIKALAASLKEGQTLEISGFYYEGETKPPGFENFGFARAEEIKKMLVAAGISADRITVRARAVDEADGVRTGYFPGYESRVLEPKEEAVATVQELDDRIIIRFPTGSTQMTYDKKVNDYLDQLAARVKQTGETISLTGHTDNVGTDDVNQTLGQERADAIKKILVGKGVKADQIQTASKGKSQPVTTNDTEAGRSENRRVEVRLNKQ